MSELTDREALLGALATRVGLITADACRAAADAKGDLPLERLLVDRGTLSDADCAALRPLVERQIARHGDPSAAIAALPTLGPGPGRPGTSGGTADPEDGWRSFATRVPEESDLGISLEVAEAFGTNSSRYRRLRNHARGN